MKGAPRSEQFDDIYFSAENGLEETQHVFIEGNNLPEAWQGKKSFNIAETGFGTGLNFFVAWKLFEETAKPDQTLDFVSFEKFPLTPDEIRNALEPWADEFDERIDILLERYPIRVAGFHRIKINAQITLTLIFDDINNALPELDANVDCWFLDGFTPAKNPDMWSETLFKEMARLSVSGASYATFTAAGDVRRGLEAAGFSVEKREGFGRKRDMIAGTFQGEGEKQKPLPAGSKVAIIGGGLAGTSCAYVLKQYGYEPVIYEKEDKLASGASGNKVGFYNPRFTAQRDVTSEFFVPAFAQLIQLGRVEGNNFDYDPCGALHLVNTPEKEKRFKSLQEKWMWHPDHIQRVGANKASEIAGLKLSQDCLYLPDSGSVSPEKLCHFYAQDIKVHLNHEVSDLNTIKEDAVILANAHNANQFELIPEVSLDKIRGQITKVESDHGLENLKCNIHYGGYVSKSLDGKNMTGATFQKWSGQEDAIAEDDASNIETMAEALDLKDSDFKVTSSRASFRSSPNDRFPLSGHINDNIYVSSSFGSHGIVGTLMSAHYLADLLRNGPKCLPIKTSKALNPHRFLERAEKRGRKSA